MAQEDYRICTRCVMDTSDPEISFDAQGVCNHCHKFDAFTSKRWFPNAEGESRLRDICADIKRQGAGQDYDCIIGLSGGIDSSYLALKIKDFGLRPLVVHVDGGWNSELAVYNIEQVVKRCGYDLHTHVIDWEEMRDLQVAYLRSDVANQDVPQDHAFFASLYHFAVKNRIKYVISGGNIATESVFPVAWHHSAMDADNLRDIHNRYGSRKLAQYKVIGILQYYFYYPFIYKMKTVRPLNYMPYDKTEALAYLQKEIGYKDYGRKHGESIFTKFFQNYYLPTKFGFDKRRPHLSSQILSGQITRDEALVSLGLPYYDGRELKEDIEYVAKKLQITSDELVSMTNRPGKDYSAYKNWDKKYEWIKRLQAVTEKLRGREIKNYS